MLLLCTLNQRVCSESIWFRFRNGRCITIIQMGYSLFRLCHVMWFDVMCESLYFIFGFGGRKFGHIFSPYTHGQSFQLMAPALWLILNRILEQNNRNACSMCSHGPPVNTQIENNRINDLFFVRRGGNIEITANTYRSDANDPIEMMNINMYKYTK